MGSLALFSFVTVICVLSMVESQDSGDLYLLLTERHKGSIPGEIYNVELHRMKIHKLSLSSVLTPTAIDYDRARTRIYWTDISVKNVRRVNFDGGEDTVIANLNDAAFPEGLAVDGDAGKLFYTDRGNKIIVKIDLDSVSLTSTTIINSNLEYPWGIVTEKKNGKVYWTDHTMNQIETCSYDGSGREIIASSVLAPTGITLDENSNRLYWCEYNGDINTINTDGTGRKLLYAQSGASFMDIAYFNGLLYSTDLTNRDIKIIPDTGGSGWILTSSSFDNINGLHVFSPLAEETGCSDGNYGIGCREVCGFCKNMQGCEKTVGICYGGCDPGFERPLCQLGGADTLKNRFAYFPLTIVLIVLLIQ